MAPATETNVAARAATASDIRTWLDRFLPAAARPYARLMRLDRPIGTWLLLFPCWWGFFLAPDSVDLDFLTQGPRQVWAILGPVLLFAIGAIVMRGAGCTYNDIVDRDFDAKVARTALRPIPSGQVSVRHAVVFLIAQLLVGLLILLAFNRTTVLLGVLSLALVFTYPLMKRVTYWPQAVLGLTFNWGALMGWAAMTNGLAAPALAL
jgi:4-hydroxybenzoate polyprenyltransferase